VTAGTTLTDVLGAMKKEPPNTPLQCARRSLDEEDAMS
jgi:hypothetical protein